ncbi:Hypothetical protein NTJ_14522 [Nesidiocoris tenuis]|uniref:Uncharacterized protein n=1 Tax=Nesidiocoris tenuis TaxID=355587 RepID=A0ABN7BBQ5_9HEMI|nr:Hypothetical protein NTJ_14522 [Nesidiocoris tenuis]
MRALEDDGGQPPPDIPREDSPPVNCGCGCCYRPLSRPREAGQTQSAAFGSVPPCSASNGTGMAFGRCRDRRFCRRRVRPNGGRRLSE